MTNFETITFPSKDGLTITADYYPVKKAKGFMLLCHRSHCNRGEYRETAPKFNKLGYSCLAIDQRSGMKIFGVTNETKNLAKEKGLPTGYLDAKQDVEAAIDFAYAKNKKKPIILVGSSYTAALGLMIASEQSSDTTKKINALITFSADEHLKQTNLAEIMRLLNIPTFATSAKKEIDDVTQLFRFVDAKYVTQFKPEVEGFHGSKMIWESVKGHETYWEAIEEFLLSKPQ